MSEESLIEVRGQKHQEYNGGKYPLATTNPSPDIRSILKLMDFIGQDSIIPTSISLEDFKDSTRTYLHGRVTNFRKNGSLAFLRISDYSGSIQLMMSKASCENFDKIKLIDLGDILEVSGYTCFSKTGEKSLLVTGWTILTKAQRPMPEKFAGLTNTETKYRKRYLDLLSSEESRAVFTIRSYAVRAIRDFMNSEGFLEVETSTLNTVNSGANAKPFTTHHNALDVDLYLRIAPELYLKRLLVGGFEKVFEIGRNYRNEGISTRHNPEFSMIEFYEAYGSFADLINYTKDMLRYVDQNIEVLMDRSGYLSYYQEWRKDRPFSLVEFKTLPMWDAIIWGASKAEIVIGPHIHPLVTEHVDSGKPDITIFNPDNERLARIDMKGMINDLISSSSIGHKIGILFEYLAEPFLTEDCRTADGTKSCPIFITQYPKEISPLARSHDRYPTLTERFELFVDGRELCNAFQELNDPVEQAIRFQEQLDSANKDPMGFDADYIEALEYGMPPAIGFGLGIDRLVMLLTNRSNIRDVILFPTLKKNDIEGK